MFQKNNIFGSDKIYVLYVRERLLEEYPGTKGGSHTAQHFDLNLLHLLWKRVVRKDLQLTHRARAWAGGHTMMPASGYITEPSA